MVVRGTLKPQFNRSVMRENILAVINAIENNEITEINISGKLLLEELEELSAAINKNPLSAIKQIDLKNYLKRLRIKL